MDELKISPNFTIDDIHKIREYHHAQTKEMSTEEMKEYYRLCADTVECRIEEKRRKRLAQ